MTVVHLVGAGPGDPDLLTLRAARLLATAEVVVYDRLVGPGIFELVAPGAELIAVGKHRGGGMAQEAINALLVARADAGQAVVRLKGGDPFVFGRGGEEALALLGAGHAVEVTPGVSSAVAGPAAAGIPVTHRGLAGSFSVVTGERRSGDAGDTNWEALAVLGGTIVVLMGVEQRGTIAARLMAGGLSARTPVAAIMRATQPDEHTVRTTLADLATAPVTAPATIVIGPVAALDLLTPATPAGFVQDSAAGAPLLH